MWDVPFDESMLFSGQNLSILCPEEHLADELLEIFKRNGLGRSWSTPNWERYKNTTVYCVSDGRLLYGSKGTLETIEPYSNYTRCTFYGAQEGIATFEAASDAEIRSLIGA